jgi:SAM-dependent methyltransferase
MTQASFGDPRGLAQRLMESALIVSIYESRLWRRNPVVEAFMGISFDDELERIAAATRVDEAARVLDLACGSGIYTRRFADRRSGRLIVGLDVSRPMLAHAARTARKAGLSSVGLVRGSALALPFPSGAFDVVNCCGALHLFPDVPKALSEVHRVLVPGGRFAAAVIRAADTPAGARIVRRRQERLGVYSFSRSDLEDRLTAAGFGDIEVLHEGRIWMIAVATASRAARSGFVGRR